MDFHLNKNALEKLSQLEEVIETGSEAEYFHILLWKNLNAVCGRLCETERDFETEEKTEKNYIQEK